MAIPAVLYLGATSEAAPLVAAAVVRQPARGARAWVLTWCTLLVVADGAQLWLALHKINNLWIAYLVTPVGGALVLWALSFWQSGQLPRLTLRLAIVPFLVAWAVLTVAFEDTSAFSRAAEPMASLMCLGAATFTLLTRSRDAVGSLLRHDWFWVTAGMALYFGMLSTVGPLSALLLGDAPGLMFQAYEVKSVLQAAAFLAVAGGMVCPAAA
ncbi:MAG: hypothetical protein ABSG61_14175 [Gemmatimonadales bacterium]|jgi:hypothetical protein